MKRSLARLANRIVHRARWYYGVHLSPHPTPVQKWFRDRGDESLRIEYPLSEASTVFAIGGYRGRWAQRIIDRYNPAVYIFEPCHNFFEDLEIRFSSNRKVQLLNYGLGSRSEVARLALLEDGSSVYREAEKYDEIRLRDVAEVVSEFRVPSLDLVMINIEGGEYALLKRMLSTGIAARCQDLQVQFHQTCPEAAELRDGIREALSKTHFLTYDYPFVWENWSKKPES